MFCPKCGNKVNDGAKFCPKCGNQFEGAQANQGSAAGLAAGNAAPVGKVQKAGTTLKLKPVGITMVVFAALALILSLLPWFEVSPRLLQLGGVASGAATLLGGTSLGTVLSFEPEYSVWNLISLSGTFNDYVSAFNSYGGSKASGATLIIAAFSWGCLILWLASLVFTIWGAITAFMKGKVGMVRTGSILMVVTVVVFFVFAASMSSDTGVPTVMPVFCLVLSVIAFVLSFFAKNKDAKKAQEDKKVQKA